MPRSPRKRRRRSKFAAGLFFFRAVIEPRIAEAGADREDPPTFHVLHERDLAQALHHRIVVHQHGGAVLADLRNTFNQAGGQVELATLPITGKVLRAAVDRAVRLNKAWAADADERCEL